ncbi:bifunctional hydroxymethylpyrimidine kinase/phosphomethylpyrimidine kinase [Halostella sp. PRR32]|uniref:bifunctional hydroxymethylpyrimidine kinase/phosphomethylpyrimidine kinase n=1 Tax=Halostella sp. PRR32 TaxID=3098147 RepID=UPI002B1D3091|nr:bifunctional hydroxymethylpyrimidine kinase/phosphomethylpyrimidine kinase [Halostella sp. PRR32]
MRQPAPVDRPVVLTVAGSDSGGGAGIQADLKTMEARGAFGTSVVTSVTAQNTTGVESTHVLPVEEVASQFDAVRDDMDVRAVKTGMLATAAVIETVTERVAADDAPAVVDPVMVATSGDRLLEREAESAYEDLVAEAALVTPNADEAAVLTGIEVVDEPSAREAGEALVSMGAEAALVKGGHVEADADVVRDVLVTADGVETFEHPRVEGAATHGSGCTLSSAIAADLADGGSLVDVVEQGVAFMERAIRYHHDMGEGPGAVHHLAALRERADRQPTAEAVHSVVREFVDADVSAVVPEVGMNVVGATPYAEETAETAAVEGRITRTMSGVQPNRGVRFGASSHVARFLLSAREFDPDLRFAVNCRFDGDVEAALDDLGWTVAEYDRDAEPEDVKETEGSTMGWGARQAFRAADGSPAVVLDRGEVGKEEIAKLVAPDIETIVERVRSLNQAVSR